MQEDFVQYLRDHGVNGFSVERSAQIRLRSKLESLFFKNVTKRMGRPRRQRWWDRLWRESWPFKWANQRLRERYAAGLVEAGIEVGV
jgi:hypothetical protein